MRRSSLVLLLLLGVSWIACGESSPPASEAHEAPSSEAANPEEASIPYDVLEIDEAEELNRTARKLAGLEGEEALWEEHSRLLSEIWDEIEARHLGPMRAWGGEQLADLEPSAGTLFYPFGGPDFMSARQFFPDARSYLLIGLEPPGRLPQLEEIDEEVLAKELERLRGGFSGLVDAGYFVAKHMEYDFEGAPRLEGMLPVLYIALAREGLQLQNVRFVDFADHGGLVMPQRVTSSTARGVEIQFFDPAKAEAPRFLYYISQDLSDEGLEAAPGFGHYLKAQGPLNVYMKSAMYLPHMDGFSRFDEIVEEHALNLLQDDSGLPYRRLDPSRWEVRLFGTYTATLPNYRDWYQPDLQEAYAARAKEEPVTFAIGYNSRISGSCLVWARRR